VSDVAAWSVDGGRGGYGGDVARARLRLSRLSASLSVCFLVSSLSAFLSVVCVVSCLDGAGGKGLEAGSLPSEAGHRTSSLLTASRRQRAAEARVGSELESPLVIHLPHRGESIYGGESIYHGASAAALETR